MNQANRFDGGREQKSDGKSLRGENWITPQGVARGGEGGMTWQAAKNILFFYFSPFLSLVKLTFTWKVCQGVTHCNLRDKEAPNGCNWENGKNGLKIVLSVENEDVYLGQEMWREIFFRNKETMLVALIVKTQGKNVQWSAENFHLNIVVAFNLGCCHETVKNFGR